mmetsp:Transcript_31142/g.77882  ORF Transcript_31142/g.77882 Transcript_31142/m.77882 type:complete len:291 (-) Transcript_31142:1301-2173(-)
MRAAARPRSAPPSARPVLDEQLWTAEARVGTLAKRGRTGLKRWQDRFCAILPGKPTLYYWPSRAAYNKKANPKQLALDASAGVIGERGSESADRAFRLLAEGKPLFLRAQSPLDAAGWRAAIERALHPAPPLGTRPAASASGGGFVPSASVITMPPAHTVAMADWVEERGEVVEASGLNRQEGSQQVTMEEAVAAGVDYDFIKELPLELQREVMSSARAQQTLRATPTAEPARPAVHSTSQSAVEPTTEPVAAVGAFPVTHQPCSLSRISLVPRHAPALFPQSAHCPPPP